MTSKVLVTGGLGFIGSHLVEQLLGRGFSVVVLDNFCKGAVDNLSGENDQRHLRVIRGDVRERTVVRRSMREVDAVLHLAALVGVAESVRHPLETEAVNVSGTFNILYESMRACVPKFVFPSSAAVYGDKNPLPLNEECELRPISPYGVSKVCGEYYSRLFCSCYGLGTVLLRYFNVYGPRQIGGDYAGVISRFVGCALQNKPLTIYGDGQQTRDFVYVGDVVDATIKAMEIGDDMRGEVFNICTGKPVSINELASTVLDICGKDLKVIYDEPRKGDVRESYGDAFKAEKVLGFRSRISLREGLERYVDYLAQKLRS